VRQDDALDIPKHPASAQNRRVIVVGSLLAVVGVAVAALGAPTFAPGAVALGVFFAWLGYRSNRDMDIVQLNNLAYERLSRGELDAAGVLLGRAERTAKGYPRRAVRLQQAVLALHRGDPESAITAATDAASGQVSLLTHAAERRFQASALAVRALAHAALGHADDAERDAEAATRAPSAGADALGRAALARMVLAAQKNELDRLGAQLREHGRAMQTLLPRERALVRAFRRMVAAGGSVYRRPARRDEADGAAAIRDWVGRVVPQAASFVELGESGTGGEIELEAPTAKARKAVEDQRAASAKAAVPATKRRALLTLGLWVVLIVLLTAIWSLLSPGPGEVPVEVTDTGDLFGSFGTWAGLAVSAFAAFAVGLLGWRLKDANVANERLREAEILVARGQPEEAAATYRALLSNRSLLVRSSAHLGLAMVAEEQGRFDEAMQDVDKGIGIVEANKSWRALASDILLPELHGMRAFLLAISRRGDEANAELALLAREFPTYPFATRTRHRVRLAQALAAGDRDTALAVARQRAPELPLSLRDEMLGDLVLATSGAPLPEGERERLEGELREDPALARWVRAVAPQLSLSAPPAGARVAGDGEHAAPEHSEAAEEAAEDEASAAGA
jgi:hypothetical protein